MEVIDAPPSEGQGGLMLDPHHVRGDRRMLARAMREGWDIKAKVRSDLPGTMAKIVFDELQRPIDRIGAARVIVAMQGQNQADRHHEDDLNLGTARLALDATQALAQMDDAGKRSLIEAAGLSHLLPAPSSPVSSPIPPV